VPKNRESSSRDSADGDEPTSEDVLEHGALVVRSNVSVDKSEVNVPGELMHEVNPYYFDRRREPPEIQDLERLYYAPCSICNRPSNDPICRCATLGTIVPAAGSVKD
jgi:molecular chaperone DnaK